MRKVKVGASGVTGFIFHVSMSCRIIMDVDEKVVNGQIDKFVIQINRVVVFRFEGNIVAQSLLRFINEIHESQLLPFAQGEDIPPFLDPAILALSAVKSKFTFMTGKSHPVSKTVAHFGEEFLWPVEAVIVHMFWLCRKEGFVSICEGKTNTSVETTARRIPGCN